MSTGSHQFTDPSVPRNHQSRKLEWVSNELEAIKSTVDSMSTTTDNTCCLQLHQEKIADLRHDVAEICDSAFKMGLDDADKLMGMLTEIE